MELDEAIKNEEEVAKKYHREARDADEKGFGGRAKKCRRCAGDHLQLAVYLRELKRLRNQERPETEWLWLGIQPDGTRWWCKNCGRHVKDTTEFCPYCGADARRIKDSLTKADNIRRMTEENLQDTIVGGYYIRDLIVTAERLGKSGVDPHELMNSCNDFLDGYKTAHEEISAQIEKSVQDMMQKVVLSAKEEQLELRREIKGEENVPEEPDQAGD